MILAFLRSLTRLCRVAVLPLLAVTCLFAGKTSVSVQISPSSVKLVEGGTQQFTATVSGTTNTAVTWSCSGGSVSSTGLYVAPSVLGTYSVTATSQADTTKNATTPVSVAAVVVGSISISPKWNPETGGLSPNPISVNPFGTLQFLADVSFQGAGTGNVIWSCTGGSVFPSTSVSGVWATFTAQGTKGTYSITATSQDDPSKTASWGISIVDASSATIYKYISNKTLTNPGDAVSLTGWFSGSGSINHGVGSVTSGVARTVNPTIINGYLLTAKSGKTSVTADVYVAPSTGRGIYTSTGSLLGPRRDYATVTLPDGRILIIGGSTLQSAGWSDLTGIEIYDPTAGTYSLAGAMNIARTDCAAVLLTDGKVFIAGGMNNSSAMLWSDVNFLSSWEVFDVNQGKTVRSGYMTAVRAYPSLTLMLDGRVLIVGGQYYGQYLWAWNTAEIFDPVAFTSTATAGIMSNTSYGPIASLLPSGKVIVADSYTAPDIFDPATGLFTPLANNTTGTPALVTGLPFRLLNGKILTAPQGSDATGLYDELGKTASVSGDLVYGATLGIANLGNGKALDVIPSASNYGIPTCIEYDPAQTGFRTYLDLPSGLISGSLDSDQDKVAYLPTVGKALVIRGSGPSFTLDPQMDLYMDVASVPLKIGLARQFRALGPQAGGVAWSVKEGTSGGSITQEGLYTAPTTPGIYHVQATSTSNPNAVATAEVLVIQTSEIISSAIINGFSASPSILSVGQSTTLTPWFSGGTGVIDNGVGAVSSGVPITVTPTVSTTYTLTVTDPSGVPVSSKVTVYLPPVISNFKAGASVVAPGGWTTLSWSVTGAATTTLKESTASGDTYVDPGSQPFYVYPSGTTTYTLTVTNPAGGTTSGPVTVIVSPIVSIAVTPATLTLTGGSQYGFGVSMSAVAGTDTSVTWSVSGGGSISASGVFTAPMTPGTCVVTATSVADPSRFASSVVTVTYPLVTLSISPTNFTLDTSQTQLMGFNLSGPQGINTTATWSIQEGTLGGTITGSGFYAPPQTPGVYHIVATSQANPSVSAISVVTVVLQSVQLSINPNSITLEQGGTYQFGYSSSNGLVTWSAQLGTISNTGLYTAPISAGTDTVIITSTLNPAGTSSSSITVNLASTPSIVVSPAVSSIFHGATQPFMANVVGISNTSVIWSIQEANGGSISNTGIYTAPNQDGIYSVVATSSANSSVVGTAKISVGQLVISPQVMLTSPGMSTPFQAQLAPGAIGPATWSVDEAGGGSVDSNGVYTAPVNPGSFHVRATLPNGSSNRVNVQVGLIDVLHIGVSVNVQVGGWYRISGQLMDASGATVTAVTEMYLQSGIQVPELSFAASDVRSTLTGDGPWKVTNVRLEAISNSTGEIMPADSRDLLGTTDAWLLSQFQRPWSSLAGNFQFNGIADASGALIGLQTTFDLNVLAPGAYSISATLAGQDGTPISGSGIQKLTLPSGISTISLTFPGAAIHQSGLSGPYKVINLVITGPKEEGIPFVGTVTGFSWSQF